MDSNCPRLAALQESFISNLVAPLFRSYADAGLMPNVWEANSHEVTKTSVDGDPQVNKVAVNLLLRYLEENYEYWVERKEIEDGVERPRSATEDIIEEEELLSKESDSPSSP